MASLEARVSDLLTKVEMDWKKKAVETPWDDKKPAQKDFCDLVIQESLGTKISPDNLDFIRRKGLRW